MSKATTSPSLPSSVALISGGMDSAVAAGLAREAGLRVLALSFDYGQRHRVELAAAARVAEWAGAVEHKVVRVELDKIGGSALTDAIAVPKDGASADTIPITYVPSRNIIFLAVALGWAEVVGAERIVIGVNALDYSGYPDCRPEFIAAFERVARLGTKIGIEGHAPAIWAPLQHLTKAEIVLEGLRLGLDFRLTCSCYDPAPDGRPCGRCDSCRLRAKGFREAGAKDPLIQP
jgi:7-cyano-7-deazaguanine synthase